MHRHKKQQKVNDTIKSPAVKPRTSRSISSPGNSAGSSSTVPPTSTPTQVVDKLKDTCGICFEPFTSLCYLDPCKHRFDYECIDPWLTTLYQHSPFLSPETMTCPMCRGVIKTIERTNPRVVTEIAQMFSGLRTQSRENSTVSGSSRTQNQGQYNNQRLSNGYHDHSHRPTPVYRPYHPTNAVPTRPPVAYRPPIITRWRTYYNQPFSYVPTTRWPPSQMSPTASQQPQQNRRQTDNDRPARDPSDSSTRSSHPERNPPREVQLLRDVARSRSRPARGWSMPDTNARSQLVRFIKTRENSQPRSPGAALEARMEMLGSAQADRWWRHI